VNTHLKAEAPANCRGFMLLMFLRAAKRSFLSPLPSAWKQVVVHQVRS